MVCSCFDSWRGGIFLFVLLYHILVLSFTLIVFLLDSLFFFLFMSQGKNTKKKRTVLTFSCSVVGVVGWFVFFSGPCYVMFCPVMFFEKFKCVVFSLFFADPPPLPHLSFRLSLMLLLLFGSAGGGQHVPS